MRFACTISKLDKCGNANETEYIQAFSWKLKIHKQKALKKLCQIRNQPISKRTFILYFEMRCIYSMS